MTNSELIARLDALTGPDREVDARIDAALRVGSAKMHTGGYEWAWGNFQTWAHHKNCAGMCGVVNDDGGLGMIWESECFTASIDSAVALCKRVLPPMTDIVIKTKTGGKYSHADVDSIYGYRDGRNAPNPAIAILIATLKALDAKETAND